MFLTVDIIIFVKKIQTKEAYKVQGIETAYQTFKWIK